MSAEPAAGNELTSFGLVELARLVRQKRVSPLELTQAFLDQIEALDRRLNAYITVTGELALAGARLAEAELMRGETIAGQPLGALHGLPLALKDLLETQGVRTTAGSKFFADYIPEQNAAVVQKLSRAGALWIGKTNMHEIALGLTSVNPHYGPVHNPWDLDRVAGGSSGGSAAALAVNMCPAALGSDTGGSIRVPAALCGVAGLKPTYGRVSLRGVIPLSWNLDHVGPMARRVEDLALIMQIIAGYDPEDPYSQNVDVPDYSSDLGAGVKGWRIALAEDQYFGRTTAEIREILNQAGLIFEQLGARVELSAFPFAYEAAYANGRMVVADAAVYHSRRLQERPLDFGDDVRQRLQLGAALKVEEYIQARHMQDVARRTFERFFEDFDLLLMPTTPVAAPPIQGPDAVELAGLLTRYTAPFNLTGLPAVSIPCGFTSGGLPVGLQLISRPWAEAALLRAAHSYESATGWHLKKPDL